MRKIIYVFVSGILAGMFIGLAAICNVAIRPTSAICGALLFGLGLFLIIMFKLFLYTGKIGLVLDNKPRYLLDLLVGLIGNFIGIVVLCKLMLLTRMGPALQETASLLVNAKENDTWYSILLLSIFCGFMIYLAVKGYKESKDGFERVICVFLSITFFILSGYEHCIANAGYYALCGSFEWHYILSILLMVLGNSIGSIVLDLLFKAFKKSEE